MKFGKLIQSLIDAALPAWKDKFLPYKYLKKRLNSLITEVLSEETAVDGVVELRFDSTRCGENAAGSSSISGSKRTLGVEDRKAKRQRLLNDQFNRLLEGEFKALLMEELDKLNEFVVEKEEEFVIKLQLKTDMVAVTSFKRELSSCAGPQCFKEKVARLGDLIRADNNNHIDVMNLQRDVVMFHGEMVLLENYSSLNYIGLVKIVKKHDRLTGAWLRFSFIPDVFQQPFYSTEILSRLVRECENDLLSLFPSSGETMDGSFEQATQGIVFQDDSLFNEGIIKKIHNSTIAALDTIRNIGRGSSTYNAFSVHPSEDNDDAGSTVEEV